jgi:hypothetical protein
VADVGALPEGQTEPYTLRAATVEDVPHLMALYAQGRRDSLVWHELSEEDWRYYITVWDEPTVRRQAPNVVGLIGRMHMIVDRAGAICGYTWVATRRRTQRLGVYGLELSPGSNWQAVMPGLLRAYRECGQQLAPMYPDAAPFSEIVLVLGAAHPAYAVLNEALHARPGNVYAWYIRIADIGGFLRHIAPLLEARLQASILSGYSGELKLNFYPQRLRVRCEGGKITAVEPWQGPDYEEETADLGCPRLLFHQMLLGYRSLAELRAVFPDVTVDSGATLLVDILFPKQGSAVRVMGYT